MLKLRLLVIVLLGFLSLLLIGVVVTIGVMALTDSGSESKGLIVEHAAGRFRVWMPEPPRESSQEVVLGTTSMRFHNVRCETLPYLRVSYCDFPFEVTDAISQSILEDARESILQQTNGKLTLAFKPGELIGMRNQILEITGTIDGKPTFYRVHQSMNQSRLYSLYIGGTQADVSGKDAKRFLDSFRMTDE